MNEIDPLIDRLNTAVRSFQEAGIDFILIGGLTMIAHGSNYITRDVDLAYAVDSQKQETP